MSIPVNTKKRGRPPGQEFPVPVQLRLSEAQAATLDEWRQSQPELPSRSEAIRRLVENAIHGPDFIVPRRNPETGEEELIAVEVKRGEHNLSAAVQQVQSYLAANPELKAGVVVVLREDPGGAN